MSQETRKLDQLTTTRFIAALSVVFFHGGRTIGILNYFPMLTSGPTAVGYFYVLSGFVMALAYYRHEIKFDFRKYWLARFSRIYPVYIISFLVTCLGYLEIMSKVKSGKILANVFLYQAWFPQYAQSFNIAAWSLSVEAFFYLIFPFLIILCARQPVKRLIWISLGFWTISQIIHSVLTIGFAADMASILAYFPLVHLNAFLLGVAGGIWYVVNLSDQKINQTQNRFFLLGALGFVLLLLSLRDFIPTFPRTVSLDAGLLAPFFLIIILALAMDTTRFSKVLSHPWLVMLGDASYALYILHVPFRWLLERVLNIAGIIIPWDTMFLTYVPVTIVICVLVYKYIERPARDWLRINANAIPLMLMDVVLIYIMIKFSFLLRLGAGIGDYLKTQNLTVRVGIIFFFAALMVFRFYTNQSWRTLALAVLAGGVSLTVFIYFAWIAGWVENFPRSIMFLISLFIFSSIYLSRLLVQFLNSKSSVRRYFLER